MFVYKKLKFPYWLFARGMCSKRFFFKVWKRDLPEDVNAKLTKTIEDLENIIELIECG